MIVGFDQKLRLMGLVVVNNKGGHDEDVLLWYAALIKAMARLTMCMVWWLVGTINPVTQQTKRGISGFIKEGFESFF